jgi:hypothetical protein
MNSREGRFQESSMRMPMRREERRIIKGESIY